MEETENARNRKIQNVGRKLCNHKKYDAIKLSLRIKHMIAKVNTSIQQLGDGVE